VAKVFLKLLKSQESGYSGDKPDQRGKYVLIPRNSLSVFPPLSQQRLNDQAPVICNTSSGSSIAVNLVYHNAKFFAHLGLERGHNEVRLYRNSALDDELKLDRGVVIGLVAKENLGEYKVFSVTPEHKNYDIWKEIASSQGVYDSRKLPQINPLSDALKQTDPKKGGIVNQREIFDSVAGIATKQRTQQPGLVDDPASVLATLIRSQKDYSDYLRQAYGGKCALRGMSLVHDSFLGLDAAHIQPHAHGGPLLPTNGILLSKDLHHAFEKGAFTLDMSSRVRVNSKVADQSFLKTFEGKLVSPEPDFAIFKPFSGYVEYHTKNLYDRY